MDWAQRLLDARCMVSAHYDALLVDWQLPDGSGLDWVRSLRRQQDSRPILMLTARDLLKDVLSEEGRATLTIEIIIKRVADHFDLRVADILGRRRPDHIAFPRQVAMFLSRTLTESSLSTIGEAFGGRDHGTVLHACRAVADRMETDTDVAKAVNRLDRELRG